MQPFGYYRLEISLHTCSSLALCLSFWFICALSCRHNYFDCDFWVGPSIVYPSNSSPLDRSFTLILAPSLRLLPSLRTSVAVLPLYRFLVSRLTIISRPGLAIRPILFLVLYLIFFVSSSISGIWCTNAQPIVQFL